MMSQFVLSQVTVIHNCKPVANITDFHMSLCPV